MAQSHRNSITDTKSTNVVLEKESFRVHAETLSRLESGRQTPEPEAYPVDLLLKLFTLVRVFLFLFSISVIGFDITVITHVHNGGAWELPWIFVFLLSACWNTADTVLLLRRLATRAAPALPGARAATDWIVAFFLFLYAAMTAHDREMLLGASAVAETREKGSPDWWMRRAHIVGCLGMALGSLHLGISLFDYQECFRMRRRERRRREGEAAA